MTHAAPSSRSSLRGHCVECGAVCKRDGKRCLTCYQATSLSVAERFARHIDRAGEGNACWIWVGATKALMGYGAFHDGVRTTTAHRASWELHVGPIPDGLHVLHRCDNPPCVRPDHLFLGTNAENVADRIAKGRWRITSSAQSSITA